MSGLMNKIANAVTGHHDTTTTAAGTHPNTQLNSGYGPTSTTAASTGTNFAGTNYGQTNDGALKEGAQVRDTGLNTEATHNKDHHLHHNKDHHLGRDVAAGAAGGAIGGVPGAAVGAGASHLAHEHHHGTHSNLSSSTLSSLGSTSMGSTSGSGLATGAGIGSGLHSTSTSSTTGLASSNRSAAMNTSNEFTDDAMTRSEEHLLVGKEKVAAGKVALNKYVTTEKVSTAVPIVRERAIVEREPITEANRDAALRGPDFKEAHYEVNLMEERAVAEKEAVPIERVRLRKEAEQTQQYVEAELRKEHIELVDGTKTLEGGASGVGAGAGLGSKHLEHQSSGSRIGNEVRNEVERERLEHSRSSSDRRL